MAPVANFNTHLSVALVASTALAGAGMVFGVFDMTDVLLLSLAGTIGGLLPDIDLDNAKVSRVGFLLASFFIATFLVIVFITYAQSHAASVSLTDALALWCMAFLVMRFGVFALFSRISRHRGMVHSVPYMAVVSLLVVYGLYYGLGLMARLSWLFGGFVFLGALIHLLLDEIYSVNIYNLKLKKSSGTALKFYSNKNPFGYMLLYGVLMGLWWFAPPVSDILPIMAWLLSKI